MSDHGKMEDENVQTHEEGGDDEVRHKSLSLLQIYHNYRFEDSKMRALL